MANFKNALELTLQEMLKQDDNMCCAVYHDSICEDNAIVMFMEYGGYETMHAVMKDLHARLSDKMGHPVSLCHNHPTDENVLIHGNVDDASVYYSDECCMRSTLGCYTRWVEADRNADMFRPELRSLFYAAETLAEGLNKTPEYVLALINWDQDPQAQMIKLLVDYHC
jgi:hypothetical protein